MKFLTLAAAGLAALPFSLAQCSESKCSDHKDFFVHKAPLGSEEYSRGHDGYNQDGPYRAHLHESCLDNKDVLRGEIIIKDIYDLKKSAEHIHYISDGIKCGDKYDRCWKPVKDAIYSLEWKLDLFDTKIDKSKLNHCYSEEEEKAIYEAYEDYGYALIKALEVIAEGVERLDGETAKFIITAVNSLRSADYTFVYELGRRLQKQKYINGLFRVQGNPDGTEPDTIRYAFALFVSTPIITGDDFYYEDGKKYNTADVEIKVDEIKGKLKEFLHEQEGCKKEGQKEKCKEYGHNKHGHCKEEQGHCKKPGPKPYYHQNKPPSRR